MKPSKLRRARNLIASLPIMLLFVTGDPVLGQLSDRFLVANSISEKNNQAVKDYDLTQISPSYNYFKAWQSCLIRTAEPLELSNVTGDIAIKRAFDLCDVFENDLRASIGAKTGLRRAQAVMDIARQFETFKAISQFGKQKPLSSGTVIVADWQITPIGDNMCLGVFNSLNVRDGDKAIIVGGNRGIGFGFVANNGSVTGPAWDGNSLRVTIKIRNQAGALFSSSREIHVFPGTKPEVVFTLLDEQLTRQLSGPDTYFKVDDLNREVGFGDFEKVIIVFKECLKKAP